MEAELARLEKSSRSRRLEGSTRVEGSRLQIHGSSCWELPQAHKDWAVVWLEAWQGSWFAKDPMNVKLPG